MNPGQCSIKADFLEHQGRKLFYLLLEPTVVEAHSSVLFLPPFAEELNKSRRIVASQARSLAAAGFNVMLLDLTGCGDAGGDFVDASWEIWLQDASFAAQTLTALGTGPLMLWGLRLGALLACELSQSRSDIDKLVLWQPVLNGEHQIDQFLRLRTAASVLNSSVTFDRKSLWNQLRSGHSLEIAGYELSPEMALEIAKARLNDFNPGCLVKWLEIGNSPNGSLSVASENVATHWREQGFGVDTGYVQGEPFWRTVDAKINLDLQRNTMDFFAQQ
jgi:exosortase A-associated hydrolase 2